MREVLNMVKVDLHRRDGEPIQEALYDVDAPPDLVIWGGHYFIHPQEKPDIRYNGAPVYHYQEATYQAVLETTRDAPSRFTRGDVVAVKLSTAISTAISTATTGQRRLGRVVEVLATEYVVARRAGREVYREDEVEHYYLPTLQREIERGGEWCYRGHIIRTGAPGGKVYVQLGDILLRVHPLQRALLAVDRWMKGELRPLLQAEDV
jgi:hypothetical protein